MNQENIGIEGDGNKIIGGDDNSQKTINVVSRRGKLSALFDKLKVKFDNNELVNNISKDLQRYTDLKDNIGLEEKLQLAGKSDYYKDFAWLKQEFYKKLVYYQNFEPAQEIFAFILGIVYEKYRNIIKPKITAQKSDEEIFASLSMDIIKPILDLINSEGCDDIIGISATEIEGMYHYLTGNCYINWKA
jgi:hypothetical protein